MPQPPDRSEASLRREGEADEADVLESRELPDGALVAETPPVPLGARALQAAEADLLEGDRAADDDEEVDYSVPDHVPPEVPVADFMDEQLPGTDLEERRRS